MRNTAQAFTRIELLALCSAVALLALAIAPALAMNKSDSERAGCFNNLRQIGHAVQQWNGDHIEEPPWLMSVSVGGTRPDSGVKPGAAWTEYISLSNELVAPRILACPSDGGVKVASTWWTGPDRLVDTAFRAKAISYGIGLHAFRELPRSLVAFDRNLAAGTPSAVCGPSAVNGAYSLTLSQPNSIRWTNGVHGLAGHLLLNDGSVRFVDSAGLRSIAGEPGFDDGARTVHLLSAR